MINHGGDSILTIYLGINMDKSYFQNRCGIHCFYTPSSSGLSSAVKIPLPYCGSKGEMTSQIIDYLKYTTYELSCPVLRDPALSDGHLVKADCPLKPD